MLIGMLAGVGLLVTLLGGIEIWPGSLLPIKLAGPTDAWVRAHLARRVESWLPDDSGMNMRRAIGYCEAFGRLDNDALASMPVEALGPVGLAYRTAAAQAVSDTA